MKLLWHQHDTRGLRIAHGFESRRRPVKQHGAAERVSAMNAGDDLHQRRFARAVFADKANNFPRGHTEVHVTDHDDAGK